MVSDNLGNTYAIINQKTKKMTTALLVMELVLQLHLHECQVAPSHVKRDFKNWADELAHPDCGTSLFKLHPWTKIVPGAVDGCSLWRRTGWKCAYGTTPLSHVAVSPFCAWAHQWLDQPSL